MANFIKATKLLKTDNGTPTNPQPIWPIVVRKWEETIKDIPEAISKMSFGKPSQKRYGAYRLEYDLKVYYQIHVIGTSEVGNHLVCDVEFWSTKKDYLNDRPPLLQNTFITQVRDPEKTDVETLLERIIHDYLIRVSLADRSGDERDLQLSIGQNDQKKLLTNPKTQSLIEKEVEIV